MTRLQHEFEPIYDSESRILILGTFPSVKSREQKFYYGNPQNRFWKVISSLYDEQEPTTIEEKTAMLRRCHIAVWDVISSCEIKGSSDSSIKDVVVNDIGRILSEAPIESVYANGAKAAELYKKYVLAKTQVPATTLPSTSPANAAWSLERLKEVWKVILG